MLKDLIHNLTDGVTRKVFGTFFLVSIFALLYINLTSKENMILVSNQFPEIDIHLRNHILRAYKMTVTAAIIFIDIILVGPFAWLSYFGDHITPKKVNFTNPISFFDLGIFLALIFTLAVIASHFTLINAVEPNPITIIYPKIIWYAVIILLPIWAIVSLLKIYSYSSDQRTDLKKYIIKL